MNKQELELEKLVNEVEMDSNFSPPPLFELYTTLFSILICVVFFLYPQMLYESKSLYILMINVMPQYAWALFFFVACLLKAIGLILDKGIMRVLGLVLSSLLYIVLCICYSMDFPSIGAITFACMAVFTAISIPLVKFTTIRHKGD